MAKYLAKLKESKKVFEWHIANLQGETSDLLSHEINEQNESLKNLLIKCWTKFERKSPELKDLTNKILTLLSHEEYEEQF